MDMNVHGGTVRCDRSSTMAEGQQRNALEFQRRLQVYVIIDLTNVL